jgi:hypothetical protein
MTAMSYDYNPLLCWLAALVQRTVQRLVVGGITSASGLGYVH